MERDEAVSLWEVSSEVAARYFVGYDKPMAGMTSLAVKVAGYGYALSCFPPPFHHVFGIHEQDSTVAVNASVSVMQAIDGRVVLVMASHGHQDILVRLYGNIGQFMYCKMGFPGRCGKGL